MHQLGSVVGRMALIVACGALLFACETSNEDTAGTSPVTDVIEDAAQAHGASYNGKMAGNLGHMGCFSLNASKGVVAGEGGLFTTNDVTLRDTADTTAVFGEVLEKGKTRDYNASAMGFMYQ